MLPGDTEELYALHREAMGVYIEQTYGPWDEEIQRDFFRRRVESGAMEVIESQGQLAGILEVERAPAYLSIVNIELAPAFQRHGIGSGIIRELQDEAASRSVPLRLQVMKVNPARRLYERLGFVKTGETETHHLMEWAPARSTRGRG
jgi:ribosomal protein S18 acetylase RimI-like enzyme